jgi:hypothetical protein
MSEDAMVKFERLQEEIIALSVLAAAARYADRDALLGHQLDMLIAPILPMIAQRADDMTFVSDILSVHDANEAAAKATSPRAHAFRERAGMQHPARMASAE